MFSQKSYFSKLLLQQKRAKSVGQQTTENNNASINGEPVEHVTVLWQGEGTAHEVHHSTHPLTISVQGCSQLQAHGSLRMDISLM